MGWRYGTWGKLHEDDENPEDFMMDVKIPFTNIVIARRFDDGSYTDEMRKSDNGAMILSVIIAIPMILFILVYIH
jgi:hypothetical protein